MISWMLQFVGLITLCCFAYAAGAESEKQKQDKKVKAES